MTLAAIWDGELNREAWLKRNGLVGTSENAAFGGIRRQERSKGTMMRTRKMMQRDRGSWCDVAHGTLLAGA